jgi:hypothetical protein
MAAARLPDEQHDSAGKQGAHGSVERSRGALGLQKTLYACPEGQPDKTTG